MKALWSAAATGRGHVRRDTPLWKLSLEDYTRYVGQTRDTVQAATFAFVVEIVPDPTRAQDAITLCVQYTDTIQQALILSCSRTQ